MRLIVRVVYIGSIAIQKAEKNLIYSQFRIKANSKDKHCRTVSLLDRSSMSVLVYLKLKFLRYFLDWLI